MFDLAVLEGPVPHLLFLLKLAAEEGEALHLLLELATGWAVANFLFPKLAAEGEVPDLLYLELATKGGVPNLLYLEWMRLLYLPRSWQRLLLLDILQTRWVFVMATDCNLYLLRPRIMVFSCVHARRDFRDAQLDMWACRGLSFGQGLAWGVLCATYRVGFYADGIRAEIYCIRHHR